MHTTSVSLLERLRQPGQAEAWARFVDLYTPLLLAWSRRLGIGRHDAEDLVQEVFALLAQKLPAFEYDHTRSFRRWLLRVFLNRRNDGLRKKRPPLVEAGLALPEVAAPDELAAGWEEEDRRLLLDKALALVQPEFAPATWQAFEYLREGRSPAEAAKELGLTTNAVYVAKSRVLRRLRQELAGLLDDDGPFP